MEEGAVASWMLSGCVLHEVGFVGFILSPTNC